MAILEIKKYKEPVLKRKAKEVAAIDEEIKKLARDMQEVVENNDGIGLAANQVGVLKRVIIVKCDPVNLADRNFFALINPKIIKLSKDKEIGEEGCLSFPGIFINLKRAKEAEIEGLDINEKNISVKASGLLARVFQHEIDHLDGILFFDRLPVLRRILFKIKNKI